MRTSPQRAALFTEYSSVRTEIRNGDVLMYRGKSLQSRIIQLITRSKYSHAGLAVWWNERLMVMEAIAKGVVVTTLSSNVRSYHGDVEWFTSVEDIPEPERMRLVEFAQQELGKEYSTWRLVEFFFIILFRRKVETRDRLRREKRLFCSYYVAQAYNWIGRDLKRNVSDRFMMPDDIASSLLLKRMGILRKREPTRVRFERSHDPQ